MAGSGAAGGVLVDTWHTTRAGVTAGDLAAYDGTRVHALQINDLPTAAEPDLFAETMHRRLLPGEGDADLVGIVRALDGAGVGCPWGVEVFSGELRAAFKSLR